MMRLLVLSSFSLCFLVGGVSQPALAAPIIYQNGTSASTANAFQFQQGSSLSVSNPFTVSAADSVTGITFSAWVNQSGATINSLDWVISSVINGGGPIASATNVPVSSFFLTTAFAGAFDVRIANFSLPVPPALAPGNYFLTLSNGVSSGGGQVLWGDAVAGAPGGAQFAGGAPVNPASSFFIIHGTPELDSKSAGLPILFSAILLTSLRRRQRTVSA